MRLNVPVYVVEEIRTPTSERRRPMTPIVRKAIKTSLRRRLRRLLKADLRKSA